MQANDEKLGKVIELIKLQNWSFNEFLIAFYSSHNTDIAIRRGHCLTKGNEAQYAPEHLLDLWLEHCPTSSRGYLERTIVDRASHIAIKEADKACAMKSLSVAATLVTDKHLDQDFLLSKLQAEYLETLPLLWFFLYSIVVSANRSEQQKQQTADSKEDRARRAESQLLCLSLTSLLTHPKQACVVIVSILLFAKNRGTNAFQIIMGIFIGISGGSKRLLGVCNHMGISVSYE